MPSINKINDLKYYADLAKEDYYNSGGEPEGEWSGLAARLLKLNGKISVNDYYKIFKGFAPDGSALCQNAGISHKAGWDLTFSAPKSVSVLWARSDRATRRRIQKAQLHAVKSAIKLLEGQAAFARRGSQGKEIEKVIGVIAALYEHSTSREQDPQLHTHCLIANLAPREDGSWGTIESRLIYVWQKALNATYIAELAKGLREIGFKIEQPEGSDIFEIFGVPKQVCKSYSKRSTQIKSLMNKIGATNSSSKIGDVISVTSRKYKKEIDRPALFERWEQEMDDIGFTSEIASEIASGLIQKNLVEVESPLPSESILSDLTEKHSIFRLQDIYEKLAIEAQWSGAGLDNIEFIVQNILQESELIALGIDDKQNQIFTTKTIIENEKQLIDIADKLQKQTQYKLPDSIIQNSISSFAESKGYPLSDEQQESVFAVCQSSLDILQGAAGAGKSTSMLTVKSAYEANGYNVIGATVARKAATQLQDETGIKSSTIKKLLDDLKAKKYDLNKTILLVDEAGQLSSQDLLSLISAVDQAKGKIILVGEDKQMDAITHGGSLKYLSNKLGCSRLENIRRQREVWARRAVQDLRNGNAEPALKAHLEKGLLNLEYNGEHTRSKLIDEWNDFRISNPKKESMILAHRWKDVKTLNDLVRGIYQQEGKLGSENIEIECSISDKSLRFEYSTGDRIRLCRNDYKRDLTNGQLGTIKKIQTTESGYLLTVDLDNGDTKTFDTSEYCNDKGHFYMAQAYASTIYSSQGTTIDGDTFVYYSTSMGRAESYVAGSRHKDNCHWYVNREEIETLHGAGDRGKKLSTDKIINTLAKQMSTDRYKSLAIEYLENKSPEIQQHFQATTEISQELEYLEEWM